jgi:hypothetical protein
MIDGFGPNGGIPADGIGILPTNRHGSALQADVIQAFGPSLPLGRIEFDFVTC